MKKTYLKSAIATIGILASTIAIEGQGAGGGAGAGAGGSAAGGSAGASVGGVSGGSRAGGVATGARAGATGRGAAGAQVGTARGLNTAGAASINQPATTPPVGGATVIGNAPNTVGGAAAGNDILASPGGGGTLGASATIPGAGAALNQQAIATTALPPSVQNALRGFSANGSLGSVTQLQGANGAIVYRATVTQNGVPIDLQISPTGQILSRTAGNVGTGPITAANAALGNAQAGLPVSSLPQPVQNGIQTQLGANGQVQTVSRDDLANGTVYRVTTTQNGIPTEMRFAANGTLLSSTPITGAGTSFLTPGSSAVAGGTPVIMSDLPAGVQTAIRGQVGNGQLNQITRGANGLAYVRYDLNGRPMLMTVGPDGRIMSNVAMNVGAAAGRTSGKGAATNSISGATNSTGRTTLKLDELPDSVQETLKREARYAEVRSITREQRVGGDVYTVALRGDNTVGELTLGSDGKVINDTRREFAELSVPKLDLDDERVTGMPFNKVPVAIQNAVKAYATASDIRSITLGTDRDGKAVYDVVFYRDGRRDRMIIAKDGTLRRIEQNVSPVMEIHDPNKEPVIAIGDLPQQAQDTIRRQTAGVLVKSITTKKVGSETVYDVRYQTNGSPVELLVSTDGRVVLPQGGSDQEIADSPIPAQVRKDELASAKVVNDTPRPARTSDAGVAASTERGSLASNTGSDEPVRTVNLEDVPVEVQNTAKKLSAGATIDSISPKLTDTGMTYAITFEQNGAKKVIHVNKDGAVVKE